MQLDEFMWLNIVPRHLTVFFENLTSGEAEQSVHPVAYVVNITYETLVSIKKSRRKEEKYSPRAQTTREESFGPLSIATVHPVAYPSCIFVIESMEH
jgi:hypothetical protein